MTRKTLLSMLIMLLLAMPLAAGAGQSELVLEINHQKDVANIGHSRSNVQPPYRGRHAGGLAELAQAHARRADWQALANDMDLMIDRESVLVEIRGPATEKQLASRRSHTRNSGRLAEAWVPLSQLRSLLNDPNVAVTPARRPQPVRITPRSGSVTSAGVTESGLDLYHGFGATGQDVTIAVIDLGFAGYSALQASGDWPANSQLKRFVVDGSSITECASGSCPAFEGSDDHGSRVVELAHDSAPNTAIWAYQVQTVGEWYQAILHASDPSEHGGLGADIIVAALSAPLDGIGDGSACPAIWVDSSGRCGTIAEAAEIAQARGTLLVSPAGNSRQRHWGGQFSATPSPYVGLSAHDWGGGNLNPSSACYAAGFTLRLELFWNDWQNVDQDYDLLLFRQAEAGWWQLVAVSQDEQDGGIAQQPQEAIAYSATGTSADCPTGFSRYAIMVIEWSAPQGPHNLQLFTNFDLGTSVAERSLVFPADSPAVFTVGAIDLASANNEAADYSGEGPVLAPGGGLPGPGNEPLVAKPDGMSFASVATVGGAFAGTSAAVPHVAGVAAVLAQLRKEKPEQIAPNPALALTTAMHEVGLTGSNDLGPPGFDTRHGYGRIRLGEVCEADARLLGSRGDELPCTCSQAFEFIPGKWHMVSLACDRRAGNNVGDTFGSFGLGTYGQQWGMFKRDTNNNAYIFLNEASELNIGEAYWIGTNHGGSGSLEGLTPDFTEAFPINATGIDGPIGRGHLVSNPRRFEISLDEFRFFYDGSEQDFYQAVEDGKLRSMFWRWHPVVQEWSSYNPLLGPAVLQPGEGVWLFVLEDVQIRIPNTPSAASNTLFRVWQSGWQVELALHGDQPGTSVRLGMHPAASDRFDGFKAERLAGMSNNPIALNIYNPRLLRDRNQFEADVRSQSGHAEWQLDINVPAAGSYFLQVEASRSALAPVTLLAEDGSLIAWGSEINDGLWLDLPSGNTRLTWRFSTLRAGNRRP